MDFAKWLGKEERSLREISRASGIALSTLVRARDEFVGTVSKARQLSELTGWRVTVADILGLTPEERRRSR